MKLLALTVAALLWASHIFALETPEMKRVMNKLGKNFATIQAALLKGDATQLKEAAHHIAHHEQPSVKERQHIMARLGSQAAEFNKWDLQVHHAAAEIANAAESGNLQAAEEAYQTALKGCFGCHSQFRTLIKKP